MKLLLILVSLTLGCYAAIQTGHLMERATQVMETANGRH